MPLWGIPYSFTVRLRAPPVAAFAWATDYEPGDLRLMGRAGTRTVLRLADGTIRLTDRVPQGRATVRETKVVQLYPDRWMWTATYADGALANSQFLYELSRSGRGSRLRFTGRQVERHAERPTPATVAARGRTIRDEDRASWRRLATALARDLGRAAARRRRARPRRG